MYRILEHIEAIINKPTVPLLAVAGSVPDNETYFMVHYLQLMLLFHDEPLLQ